MTFFAVTSGDNCPHCNAVCWVPNYAVQNLCKDSCSPHYYISCVECGDFSMVNMCKTEEDEVRVTIKKENQ